MVYGDREKRYLYALALSNSISEAPQGRNSLEASSLKPIAHRFKPDQPFYSLLRLPRSRSLCCVFLSTLSSSGETGNAEVTTV